MKYLIISGSSDIGTSIIKSIRKKNKVIFTYNNTKPSELSHISSLRLDILSKKSIKKFIKKKIINDWDCLVFLPASQDPVGPFNKSTSEDWVKSVNLNFTNQIYLLRELLDKKSNKKNFVNSVVFWAGGGVNDSPKNYSAYIVSKIAQIKMVELLDNEIDDVKFSIIGPGWVKTKIHQTTFLAKDKAGDNFFRSQKIFNDNNFVSMKQVVTCFNQIVKSKKKIFGGRNVSAKNDQWNEKDFRLLLETDENMFKLRRNKNDFKISDINFDGSKLLDYFYSELSFHGHNTYMYKQFKEIFHAKYSYEFLKNKKIDSLLNMKIYFPCIKMGKINSSHLLGLDELLIFKYYYNNRNKYKKVCDIGANIGLHSLIMRKCGFKVDAFEPDPRHFRIAKKIFKKNKIYINLRQEAISNFDGKTIFTRVLNNSTGSYIGNKKEGYGPLKRFKVNVCNSIHLRNKYDLIKIDAEGSEYEILQKFTKKDFKKTDFIIEISTFDSRQLLWDFFCKLGLKAFAQKISWKCVKNIFDLPSSPKEGSVIISDVLKI
jgi:FkbM family methyltransferase